MVENLTILSMSGVSKSFPGVKALDNVSLDIRSGEIHGLVGENGAGKSTLIKVLAGVYHPEFGQIIVANTPVSPLSSDTIHAAGVRFIHQELHLVPYFTVSESVFMGQEISSVLGLKKRKMKERTEQFFKDVFGVDIDSSTLVKDLTVTERKMVQIARALIDKKAKVIVFDEPTAALGSKEAKQLIAIIKKLRESNVAIIYISHYLSEITDLCDRVTVLRNGQMVDVVDSVDDNSTQTLIKLMVGREIDCMYPEKHRQKKDSVGLKIENLSDNKTFENINFQVNNGEIVGITGLLGSGREEVVDTIYGLRKKHLGKITICNQTVNIKNPSDSVANGMVLVPRDRRKSGLVLEMDTTENINLGSYKDVSKFTLENRQKSQKRAQEQIKNLAVRPAYLDVVTKNFSGGNQQKIVLGRWLCTDADVFIFDEPTVGVDIGAKSDIYQLLENLAKEGSSVIVSSSDPSELIGMCDRILVMKRGKIDCELSTDKLSIAHLIDVTTRSDSEKEEA